MSGARGAELVFYALLLLLPLSALAARRIPLTSLIKMAAAWIIIFGLAALIISRSS